MVDLRVDTGIDDDAAMVLRVRAGFKSWEQPPERSVSGPDVAAFFLKDVDATAVFELDAAGRVVAMTVTQNGRPARATRID
jgi:hypothetical protein